MKNFLTSVLTLLTLVVFSQGSYTSQNSKTSTWETASIWTKQYSWMAVAPPGPANVGGSYTVNINGYVTRNGNLTFSSSALLNVYDTLVIKGNFTISSSQGVVVHSGGVLIVLGNLTSTSSSGDKLDNNGNVVVTGEFSHSGGSMDTNGKVYSFDTTPTFGWGSSVNGVNYNGNNTNGMANQLRSKANLASNNPALSRFVSSLLGVMPVKLISFTGTLEQNSVSLTWITSEEQGFDHFEIERASADLVFEKIAQVSGAGYNTEDEQAYEFTDTKTQNGTRYYRLKSVDLDGTFEYSSIVSVTVAVSKAMSVYPNPSNGDFVNVSTNGELLEDTWVSIFNENGVLIQKTRVDENDMRVNFARHLSSGVYILKYTSPDYSQTVRLFVK
jgi:Secretion system C-terminal sorting domain